MMRAAALQFRWSVPGAPENLQVRELQKLQLAHISLDTVSTTRLNYPLQIYRNTAYQLATQNIHVANMSDTGNAAAAATNPTSSVAEKPEVKDAASTDVATTTKANGDGDSKVRSEDAGEEKWPLNGKDKKDDRRGGRDDRDRKGRDNDRRGGGDRECFNCHKKGHQARECPEERRGGDRNNDRRDNDRGGDRYNDRRGGGRGRGGPRGGGGSGNMNYQKYATLELLQRSRTDSHAQAQQRV